MPDSALTKRRPMPQHLCCALKYVVAYNSAALFMLLLWLPSVGHGPALIWNSSSGLIVPRWTSLCQITTVVSAPCPRCLHFNLLWLKPR